MVEELISRARRRFVLNEGLAQTALAAAVAIGGFAVLLIAGTGYLGAWTVSLFAIAGVAIGVWQLRNRIPGAYETARRVDENAGLQDALSTALYFSQNQPSNGSGSEAFRQSQREQAEKLTGSVNLESTVPFTFPRSVYAMAGMALLVSALIGLRYRAGQGIDLRAPITQVLFQDLAAPAGKEAKKGGPRGNRSAMEKAIDQALEGPRPPDKKEEQLAKKGETKPDSSQPSAGDPIENNDPSVFDQVDLEGNQASNKEGDNQEAEKKSSKELSQSEKESLLSKLKDAVENLLKNKKDGNQDGQKGQQQAKRSDSKNAEKGKAEKGDKEKGQDDQSSQQEAEAEADAERAKQEAQAKQNSSSQSQQKSEEGDGIGKQDGKKDIKLAEQLKAMGKISEIIGQRAADISGETTIEKQSGDQNLATAYSNTKAAHGEADGDVTRDQIPLALQAYVQQYFQQVRKTSSPAKKPAAPAPLVK